MKYEPRVPNPDCDCGHAYYSHGMAVWGYAIALSGIFISLAMILILEKLYGVSTSHTIDPRDYWILLVSFIPMNTLILFIKTPFRIQCLLCKCPKFIDDISNTYQ